MPINPLTLSPAVWLQPDALTGFAGDDPVPTVTDFSGNARHAVQVSSGQQPIYKLGIVNGLPVVRFDGLNDYLSYQTSTDTFLSSTEMTLFMVTVKRLSAVTFDGMLSTWKHTTGQDYVANENGLFGYGNGPADDSLLIYRAGTPQATISSPRPILTPYLIEQGFDSSGNARSRMVYGTTDLAAQNAFGPESFASDNYVIASRWDGGPNYYAYMDFAELVLFNYWLNDAQRAAMRSYLTEKWAVVPVDPRAPARRLIVPSRRSHRLAGGWAR